MAEQNEVVQMAAFTEALGLSENGTGEVTLEDGTTLVVRKLSGAEMVVTLNILKAISIKLDLKNMMVDKDDDEGVIRALAAISMFLRDPVNLIELVTENYNAVLELIGGLVGRKREEVRLYGLDDLLMLVYMAWTVNERFFTTKLIPMFRGMMTVRNQQSASQSARVQ